MVENRLTHLRSDGSAHMVDVSAKAATAREAVAEATFRTRADVVAMICDGTLPKGEALSVARVAAILAAKQTHLLVPLCHPLPLTRIAVDLTPDGDVIRIRSTVATTAPTGVEMEALTACSVAGLTLYDMVKAVDRSAELGGLRVVTKTGGTHDWHRDE